MESNLSAIAKEKYPFYDGGKDMMGYFPFYDKYLPKSVNDFLEIGIWKGNSLRMFRDYYSQVGNFHAMNISWGFSDVVDIEEYRNEGFICYEGNQGDINFLKTIETKFDVIIDDGSHHSDEQIITFKQMFLNNLQSGGQYFIEDCHCCKEEYWWRGIVNGFDNTILGVVKKYLSGEKTTLDSQWISGEESSQILSSIKDIEVLCNECLILFNKK